jgi:hypothetical protein
VEGSVEAFHLAVLPGAVGSDGDVLGIEPDEGFGEGSAFGVAPVVVGHDGLDPVDAVISEEGGRSGQESRRGGALFVREDLRVGKPGVVVDG